MLHNASATRVVRHEDVILNCHWVSKSAYCTDMMLRCTYEMGVCLQTHNASLTANSLCRIDKLVLGRRQRFNSSAALHSV